ncbi:hypothetical protein CJ195_22450 [Bacillus sp. UMB0899]|nr:hypothetical protein CJ195_22450 [Bacillus sp. UMB0899]
MYDILRQNSTTMLVEVKEHLNLINGISESSPRQVHTSINSAKGLFFVHIYGVFEFTVKNSVNKTLQIINNTNVKISECKPIFMTLALNNCCDSLNSVGPSRQWEKRWDIFSKIDTEEIVFINEDVFPTDGKNIRKKQLESIFKSFGISEPILPRSELGGTIMELVENRNKVAHGEAAASEIGKRYSMRDLFKKYDDISETCTYIINTFEEYTNNHSYKKQA